MIDKGEVLTDNTKINYCEQCKDCVHWGNDEDDYFTNEYDKASCDMYETKPIYVLDNSGECEYKESVWT